jgi:hypothetical protein
MAERLETLPAMYLARVRFPGPARPQRDDSQPGGHGDMECQAQQRQREWRQELHWRHHLQPGQGAQVHPRGCGRHGEGPAERKRHVCLQRGKDVELVRGAEGGFDEIVSKASCK